MPVEVKICGLQDEAALQAALDGGAAFVGFVFVKPSRNFVAPDCAAALAQRVPAHVKKVGLFVDAADAEIRAALDAVPLDMLQLHGAETPERMAEIKRVTGLPVMKALRIMEPAHLDRIAPYETVADMLLFDSRSGHQESGGPIDWKLLKGLRVAKPWMLAGGLNAANLAEAVRHSGASRVDVSSGVEDEAGRKSPARIDAFLKVAATL